jgi:hypothetical protein
MQPSSSIAHSDTPFAGTVPLIFTSPSSKAKLLLLDKRLTGGDSQQQQADQTAAGMAQQAGASSGSAQNTNDAADLMDEDVQICAELNPGQQQQQTPPGSGLSAPASKRRKTGNPKHRPLSADQHDNSRGALPGAAAPAGKDAGGSGGPASGQRDRTPTNTARVSPRGDRAGFGGDAAGPGGSNPPMSPVAVGITGARYCAKSSLALVSDYAGWPTIPTTGWLAGTPACPALCTADMQPNRLSGGSPSAHIAY